MLRREASPVHAIFVSGGESSICKSSYDFAKTAEALFFLLIAAPRFLSIRHNANDLGAEAFHARDGALDFGSGLLEVTGDGFSPVADEGAKFGDGDAGFVELVGYEFEFFFWEFVDVTSVDSAG